MNGKLIWSLLGILYTAVIAIGGWTVRSTNENTTELAVRARPLANVQLAIADIPIIRENQRNIHHEIEIDRSILNRIDRNTGGSGKAPPVRPLRCTQ